MTKGRKPNNRSHLGGKKDLLIKEDGQDYAKVTRVQGHCNYKVKCAADDIERLGHVRGSLGKRHKKPIRDGMWVLVSLRDFQPDRCDIIHCYTDEQVRELFKRGEIEDAGAFTACTTDIVFCEDQALPPPQRQVDDSSLSMDFEIDDI